MNNKEKAIHLAENNLDRCFGSERDYGVTCALEMAQWKDEQFLKLWHIADNEQPDGSRAVLIYDNAEGYAVGCYSSIRPNHKWAYIDELLPPKTYSVYTNENLSLDEEYKIKGWVARDKNNLLCVYTSKPHYNQNMRIWEDSEDWFEIDEDYFPEVQYYNEPIEVELTIKKV